MDTYCKGISLIQLLALTSFSAYVFGLSPNGENVCSARHQRRESFRQYYSTFYVKKYYKRCGFAKWSRCAKYRHEITDGYRTSYRIVYWVSYDCCSGWTKEWYGAGSCSRPICNPRCRNGGRCSRPGVCTCATGYTGNRCQTPICSPSCTNGGTCTRPNSCSCRSGFTGNRCQTPICSPSCRNGGTCIAPGQCSCRTGYTGYRCQTPICRPNCRNGGRCSSPGVCSCGVGYTGNRCQTPICSPSCRNGGTCIAPGRCSCRPRYTGNRCQTPICYPNCQNGGRCSSPDVCTCSVGYTGDRCQTPICFPRCENGGTCVHPGVCSCVGHFVGLTCEEAVSITCPANVSQPNDCNVDYAVVIWKEPRAEAGGEIVRVASSHVPGMKFHLGMTTVIYTVTDIDGRIVRECNFDVTVIDTEEPIIVCPENIRRLVVPEESAIITWRTAISYDNSGVVSVSSSHQPGQLFAVGETRVSYQAIDPAGNVKRCSFNVSIEEYRIICPSDIFLATSYDVGSSIATWDSPTVIGEEQLGEVTSNYQSGDQFTIGITEVRYSVYDKMKNFICSCSFRVEVMAVSLTCPANISVPTDHNADYAVVHWQEPVPPVPQNVEGLQINVTHLPGTRFELGTTIVTYTVYVGDDERTVTKCSFHVKVVDTEVPSISCPDDILTFTDSSIQPPVTWEGPIATDNSGHVDVNCSHVSGDVFPIGINTVHCTVHDPYGNQNTCDFEVFVEGVTISCPKNVSAVINEGSTTGTVSWAHPEVLGGFDQVYHIGSHHPGKDFPVGSSLVEYIVYTQESEPITSCSFTIDIYDPDIPTLVCPNDIYEFTESDTPKEVFWNMPEVFDFSGTARLTYFSHEPGMLFMEGTTLISYEAMDFTDKTGNCSFSVTVEGVAIICPNHVNATTDSGSAFANVTWYPPEVIGGEGLVEVNITEELWQLFPIGDSSITYDVFDSDGSVLTNCTFEIHVEDHEKPTIACPDDVLALTQPSFNPSVSWDLPLVKDNSGGVEKILSSFQPGDRFLAGTTVVVYSTFDQSGNSNQCYFQVHVKEIAIKCPPDFSVSSKEGLALASNVTWLPPVVTGEEITFTSNRKPGDSFTLGRHTVTYKLDLPILIECNFTITVYDKEPPEIQCPEDISVLLFTGNTSVNVRWNTATAYDNSGQVVQVTSTYHPGDVFHVGTTHVSYTAFDSSDNSATCDFRVTVEVKCYPETLAVDDVGMISWPVTAPETIANSSRRCPIDTMNGDRPIATRRCSLDTNLGAMWDDPELVDCGADIALTLDMLIEVPLVEDNVVEIASGLSDVTNNMTSVTTHEFILISQVIENIVDIKSDSPQVSSALAQTASHVMAANYSIPCQKGANESVTIEALQLILKLVERQIEYSFKTEQLNIRADAVFIDGQRINEVNAQHGVEMEMMTDNFSMVKAKVFLKEECYVWRDNLWHENTGIQTLLSVYDTHRLSTSIQHPKSIIVSPLAVVKVSGSICNDLSKPVEIQLPLNLKDHGQQVMIINSTLRCALLDLFGNDQMVDWSEDECETIEISQKEIICRCRRMAMYMAVVDYRCMNEIHQEQVSFDFGFYGRIGCFVVVIALFLSLVMVLAKREWLLPTHQQILFHLYLSLCCLYFLFIIIGQLGVLPVGCEILNHLIYYFILTSLMWFAVEAMHIYISALKMGDSDSRRFLWISAAIAWFLPVVLVIASFYLGDNITTSTSTCMIFETRTTRLTVVLPAVLLLLFCIISSIISSIRILKTRRKYYPHHRCVRLRCYEFILLFTFTVVNMGFALNVMITLSPTSRILFFTTCLGEGICIFGMNCIRVLPQPGRSGKYRVHVMYDTSEDTEEDTDGNDYISSPFEMFQMADFTQHSTFTTNGYRN